MAMKIKTYGYHIKQGFKSVAKNKMMSIASISTVVASLLILGIFLITMFNVDFLVKDVESGVEIKVYLKDDITNNQKAEIESQMKLTQGVTAVEYESKEEALEKFKAQLGDNSELVAGINAEEVMPSSYIIKMEGPKFVQGTVEKLKTLSGIDEIKDGGQIVDKLMQITGFVKTLGISLLAILTIVSVFLISNTIKLTVLARRREIGIMKYIGATDWFIRWPFVIEGLFLGLIGAVISALIVGYGYVLASNAVARNMMSLIRLVDPMDIVPYMSAAFAAMGLLIGSVGSIISMRKFLKV
jgi:cell division transport system permease protein